MSQADPEVPKKETPLAVAGQILLFILQILLFVLLFLASWLVLRWDGPVWGLLAAVGVVFVWGQVGPKPFPGFLPGLLAMAVVFSNAACGLAALRVLLLRLIHHTA